MPKINLPSSPDKFANTVVKLIDNASPNKKQALQTENIQTSTSKRMAFNSIVSATTSAMATGKKIVRKTIVKELRHRPSKREVSYILPVSRSTLHRRSTGIVGRPALCNDAKKIVRDFYNKEENLTIFPNKSRTQAPAQPLKVLNYSKKKLFVLFRREFPEIRVSKSSFW